MQSTTSTFRFCVLFSALLLVSLFCFVQPVQAEDTTAEIEPQHKFYELKATLAYLEAFVEALRAGELSPGPTMLVALSGSEVSLVGTLARTPDADRMETCGPMVKGQVDWGDGVTENIMGLGCSGNTHSFSLLHEYNESGSYQIVVTDDEGREKTHVVAVRVK